MKRTTTISLALALLVMTVSALAQVTDWNAVQRLRTNTKIHVTLKRGRVFGHCYFEGASDTQLVCSERSRFDSRTVAYPRDNVKAVYLVHNAVAIGIGIGAGTGAVLGATKSSCCPGANAVIAAGFGGLLGAFGGMVADPFVHGRVVYRSPNPNQVPRNTAVPNQHSADQEDVKIPCLRDGVSLRCMTPENAAAPQVEPVAEQTDH